MDIFLMFDATILVKTEPKLEKCENQPFPPPYSFPDFGHSAGHSKLLPHAECNVVSCTVVNFIPEMLPSQVSVHHLLVVSAHIDVRDKVIG